MTGLKQKLSWCTAGILTYVAAYYALSDTLTYTAYYPSPMGVYATLNSTQDTWLATQGGQVVVGSKNPASIAKLDVEGKGGMYVNGQAVVTGIATANQGLLPGTIPISTLCSATQNNGMLALTTCTGGTPTLCYCNGASGWQPLSSQCTVQVVVGSPGSNPTCPAGTTPIDYDYTPITCGARLAGDSPCTTSAGWQSQGYGTCSYDASQYGQPLYACWGPSTPSGCICQSNQWMAVKCAPTPCATPAASALTLISGTNPTCPNGQHANFYYYTGTTCMGSLPSPNYCTCHFGITNCTPDSCTTPPGWLKSPNTCTYQSRLVQTGWAWDGEYGNAGVCSQAGPTATCVATNWNSVQCVPN